MLIHQRSVNRVTFLSHKNSPAANVLVTMSRPRQYINRSPMRAQTSHVVTLHQFNVATTSCARWEKIEGSFFSPQNGCRRGSEPTKPAVLSRQRHAGHVVCLGNRCDSPPTPPPPPPAAGSRRPGKHIGR